MLACGRWPRASHARDMMRTCGHPPDKVLFPETHHQASSRLLQAARGVLPHLQAARHHGAVPLRHRTEGVLAEGRFAGFRLAAARRGPEEGRRVRLRWPPTRGRSSGCQPDAVTLHVWALARPRLFPPTWRLRPRSGRGRSRRARAAKLQVRDLLDDSDWRAGEDERLERVPRRRPLDARPTSTRWRRSPIAPARARKRPPSADAGVPQARPGSRVLVKRPQRLSATFAAAYTVRPARLPRSAPCWWDEVETRRVGPRRFTLRSMGSGWTRSAISEDLPASGQSVRQVSERLSAVNA